MDIENRVQFIGKFSVYEMKSYVKDFRNFQHIYSALEPNEELQKKFFDSFTVNEFATKTLGLVDFVEA
ncbi:MAG: hypothetical protein ACR2HS_03155, partial [Gammaproteobacteria bacterium]